MNWDKIKQENFKKLQEVLGEYPLSYTALLDTIASTISISIMHSATMPVHIGKDYCTNPQTQAIYESEAQQNALKTQVESIIYDIAAEKAALGKLVTGKPEPIIFQQVRGHRIPKTTYFTVGKTGDFTLLLDRLGFNNNPESRDPYYKDRPIYFNNGFTQEQYDNIRFTHPDYSDYQTEKGKNNQAFIIGPGEEFNSYGLTPSMYYKAFQTRQLPSSLEDLSRRYEAGERAPQAPAEQ